MLPTKEAPVTKLISVSSVTVLPDRQRQKLGDLTDLQASLQQVGLLNPIIVEAAGEAFVLIAGERRLRAAQELGWLMIEARIWPASTSHHREVLEFEENAKRKDLTWQEETQAVARYHQLMLESDPTWSAASTAANLSISKTQIYRYLSVSEQIQLQPQLLECASVDAAYNVIIRQLERKMDAAMDLINLDDPLADPPAQEVVTELAVRAASTPAELNAIFDEITSGGASSQAQPAPSLPSRPARVIRANFLEWAETYQGLPFNFIHCDFPYGVDMGANALQGTRRDFERYEDSADTYWSLFKALFQTYRQKLISSSAHVMFWLSPNFLGQTLKKLYWLTDPPGQIRVDPWPLIWHKSDNKGLLPDPQRGTRHTYEMALHITFGDRKIARPVAASFAAPLNKGEAVHLSEKPQEVLEHFFRLYVDASTRMLDPTCGSGNALAVADRLGAESVFGLDIGDISNAERILSKPRT